MTRLFILLLYLSSSGSRILNNGLHHLCGGNDGFTHGIGFFDHPFLGNKDLIKIINH
jgi:hypothetical protein